MLALPLLVLLASAGGSAAGPAVTARTLYPCYSANLKPAPEVLVSAVGCTVLFTVVPPAAGKVVSWEYESSPREAVIVTYVSDEPAEISPIYENRVRFNETDFSLRMVLQWWDGGLYRFRSESEATGWFQLRVVEPLSKPEIVGNSSVKAGGDTKLFCSVLGGKADVYWWMKDGKLLLGSDRLQFIRNDTLRIVRALMNDSGYYTCVVSNEVSQNETSFLLHVHNASNVFFPVILVFVVIGLLAAAGGELVQRSPHARNRQKIVSRSVSRGLRLVQDEGQPSWQ